MDAFFAVKNKYLVFDTLENVHSELSNILDRRWYDFSENISGKLNPDGRFKISPKWTMGYIRVLGGSQDFTYLSGTLKAENNNTVIEATTRPNYTLVIVFYFLIFIGFMRLLGYEILGEAPLELVLLFVLTFCGLLTAIMVFGVFRLRARFERLMHLTRQD